MSVLFFHTDPDEMIYDDVELGEEGGCNSSLDNGWSSSEFESYDEASDGEGRPENGLPHAFMRGKPPQRKTHVCITITLPFPCRHYSQQTSLLLIYCTSVAGRVVVVNEAGIHFSTLHISTLI